MFAMKIAFARLLFKLVALLVAVRRYLNNIEDSTYKKQLTIRAKAERAARAARRAETTLAQQALERLVETQAADERAITTAAWRN